MVQIPIGDFRTTLFSNSLFRKKNMNNPHFSILKPLLILIITAAFSAINADNPLVRHIYTADPAPLVYNDTFYIFTGHDEGGEGWTLNGWHVLSSTDMVHWTDHEIGRASCRERV